MTPLARTFAEFAALNLVILVFAFAFTACPAKPQPSKAGLAPDSGAACPARCAALRAQGCESGTGYPGGESCEDVCRRRAALGLDMPDGC
jgi:hypothetical protein